MKERHFSAGFTGNSKEPRKQLRSKCMFWVSRNASWTWIMIIWGIISPVEGTGSFYLWLLNANLKNPLGNICAHNCKGLDTVTSLIHPSLAELDAVYNSLYSKEINWAYKKWLYILIWVSPCAVCYLGIHQTEINNSCWYRSTFITWGLWWKSQHLSYHCMQITNQQSDIHILSVTQLCSWWGKY